MDPLIKSQLLYQLSYAPTGRDGQGGVIATRSGFVEGLGRVGLSVHERWPLVSPSPQTPGAPIRALGYARPFDMLSVR